MLLVRCWLCWKCTGDAGSVGGSAFLVIDLGGGEVGFKVGPRFLSLLSHSIFQWRLQRFVRY